MGLLKYRGIFNDKRLPKKLKERIPDEVWFESVGHFHSKGLKILLGKNYSDLLWALEKDNWIARSHSYCNHENNQFSKMMMLTAETSRKKFKRINIYDDFTLQNINKMEELRESYDTELERLLKERMQHITVNYNRAHSVHRNARFKNERAEKKNLTSIQAIRDHHFFSSLQKNTNRWTYNLTTLAKIYRPSIYSKRHHRYLAGMWDGKMCQASMVRDYLARKGQLNRKFSLDIDNNRLYSIIGEWLIQHHVDLFVEYLTGKGKEIEDVDYATIRDFGKTEFYHGIYINSFAPDESYPCKEVLNTLYNGLANSLDDLKWEKQNGAALKFQMMEQNIFMTAFVNLLEKYPDKDFILIYDSIGYFDPEDSELVQSELIKVIGEQKSSLKIGNEIVNKNMVVESKVDSEYIEKITKHIESDYVEYFDTNICVPAYPLAFDHYVNLRALPP